MTGLQLPPFLISTHMHARSRKTRSDRPICKVHWNGGRVCVCVCVCMCVCVCVQDGGGGKGLELMQMQHDQAQI